MDGFDPLFETVLGLSQAGFIGVGITVLLLVFLILFRGKPADEATHRLYNRFLTLGMAFAFFCGVLAVITPLIAPAPVAASGKVAVKFSPRFETENLPKPIIELPGMRTLNEGETFVPASGDAPTTVNISVDDALHTIRNLKKTTVALAETAASAQQQAQEAVEALATSEGSRDRNQVNEAARDAADASKTGQIASKSIAQAVAVGDLAKLETQSKALQDANAKSKTAIFNAARAIRP